MNRSELRKNRVIGERRSVQAERDVENNDVSPFNRGSYKRATVVTDEGFISRLVYPELEGIRDALHRAAWSGEVLDETLVKRLTESTIKFALEARKEAHDCYTELAATLESEGSDASIREAHRCQVMISQLRQKNIFSEIVKYDLNRFESDGTVGELYRLFKEGLEDMHRSSFSIQSCDEAWIAGKTQA